MATARTCRFAGQQNWWSIASITATVNGRQSLSETFKGLIPRVRDGILERENDDHYGAALALARKGARAAWMADLLDASWSSLTSLISPTRM